MRALSILIATGLSLGVALPAAGQVKPSQPERKDRPKPATVMKDREQVRVLPIRPARSEQFEGRITCQTSGKFRVEAHENSLYAMFDFRWTDAPVPSTGECAGHGERLGIVADQIGRGTLEFRLPASDILAMTNDPAFRMTTRDSETGNIISALAKPDYLTEIEVKQKFGQPGPPRFQVTQVHMSPRPRPGS